MKNWIVTAVCGVLLLEPLLTFGQESEPSAAPAATDVQFGPEQIDQIAAPVALYPDDLLAQVMMAATYPVEVVKADRFMSTNPTLAGEILAEALQAFDWDPSIKSLCAFPDVLRRMSENLDWTQDLGDAFLGQSVELMDSIQRLRKQAQEQGTLESTTEQTVAVEDGTVVIEPASTEVLYVPTYYPSVIYPSSSYLYYPTLYVAPPPQAPRYGFAAGVVVGAAVWGHCDWHNHSCSVRVDHHNYKPWVHAPAHRRGAPYGNPAVAHHYGPPPGRPPVSRDQARGYDRPAGSTPRPPAAARPPAARPPGESRPPAASRPLPKPSKSSTNGSRGGAYSGSKQPSMDARASQRGAQVRSTPSRSSGGGGAARSGGGRAAGGGRGR